MMALGVFVDDVSGFFESALGESWRGGHDGEGEASYPRRVHWGWRVDQNSAEVVIGTMTMSLRLV